MMPHVEQNSLVSVEQLAHEVEVLDGLSRPDRMLCRSTSLNFPSERRRRWLRYTLHFALQGAFVSEFQARLADYCKAAHAVAMVNGTAALEVALRRPV